MGEPLRSKRRKARRAACTRPQPTLRIIMKGGTVEFSFVNVHDCYVLKKERYRDDIVCMFKNLNYFGGNMYTF
jgi:hypothetical protein